MCLRHAHSYLLAYFDDKWPYKRCDLLSLFFTCIAATSNGLIDDIDKRVGGRCAGQKSTYDRGYVYKMKLRLRMCSPKDADTERCPICMTAACYNKGVYIRVSNETSLKLIALGTLRQHWNIP